jgi:hypothetical protein
VGFAISPVTGRRARSSVIILVRIAALLWCGCALAPTNDRYIRIAGPSGLFRFDGIAFERVELRIRPVRGNIWKSRRSAKRAP